VRNYIRYFLYCIVAIGISVSHAGSYEDFFTAIQRDDAPAVIRLLRQGFDPNARDSAGQHGLYLALREPSLKTARALIDWPATDVDARNARDESPLMMAALRGHADLVVRLVERGADVNKTGWAPLHYASTKGDLVAMQVLLDHHAYIDAESPNGSTPLMLAAMYGTPSAVKLLLVAGADPTLKNEQGLTAIDFAHRASRQDIADMIAAAIRDKRPRGTW
jgi:uncharacterized protein